MNLTCENEGRVRTIRVYGDLNRNELTTLSKCLRDLDEQSEVRIDLSEADFAGTDFINLLVEVSHRYPDGYGKIIFFNPNDLIRELMSLTQLDRIYRLRNEPVPVAVTV